MKYHKSVLGKLIATIIMSFMTYIAEAQASTNCCSQPHIISYRKAAERGDTMAMKNLGHCYENGNDVAKDEAEAVKWYRKAADLGDAEAMFKLGNCYANGTGVTKDEAEAFKWFHEAAEQCVKIETMHRLEFEFEYILKAMIQLGDCYQNGRGITKSEEQGVTWYRKTIAFGEKIIANRGSNPADIGTVDSNDERISAANATPAERLSEASAIIDELLSIGIRGDISIAMNKLGDCYEQGTGVPKDEAEAVKWYRKAAELDNALAMYNLGYCYANGTGIPKDEAEAVKWWRKVADLGNALGMFNLGNCYHAGIGVPKDEAEAVKWYRKAAELGYYKAMYNLGVCYRTGTGVPKDEAEAVKWYCKAAELGNAKAMSELAFIYSQRYNEHEASYWTKEAIGHGYKFSLLEKTLLIGKFDSNVKFIICGILGLILLLMFITFKKDNHSRENMEDIPSQSWSIRIGSFHGAPIYLGASVLIWLLFDINKIFSEDFSWSRQLYRYVGLLFSILIHELSHAYAGLCTGAKLKLISLQFFGGFCKFKTPNINGFVYLAGPISNLLLAVAFYYLEFREMIYLNLILGVINLIPMLPLDGGYVLSAITTKVFRHHFIVPLLIWITRIMGVVFAILGIIILSDKSGWGIITLLLGTSAVIYAKNYVAEYLKLYYVKRYRKAAELGDAEAMYNLGVCYGNGIGVPKDEAEAVKWWRKAADLGNAEAMFNLGICYDNGTGVPKDEAEAVKWYRKAADLGDALGMYNLGVCYKHGTGVPKDEAEAVKWWRKAADLGNALGMYYLGGCYYAGIGVPKDEAEAVKWYRKAADLGDAGAMGALGVCYKHGIGVSKDEAEAVKWYRKAAELGNATAKATLAKAHSKEDKG